MTHKKIFGKSLVETEIIILRPTYSKFNTEFIMDSTFQRILPISATILKYHKE